MRRATLAALGLLATPLGSPLSTSADGTRVNGARSGRLRIVPSGIGEGYELQFDRTFGSDSRGRPETLHLGGVADITLSGATQMSLGYNGKGYFRTYRGDVFFSDLGYNLRTKVGAQDASLVGSLNVSNSFEINPLGFYTYVLQVENANSQFTLEGVGVRDQKDMNFSVGPISIRGNLYYDGLLAVLTSLGVDTTQLEDVFPRSPISEIDDAIREALQQQAVVAGTAVENDVAPLLIGAIQGDADAANLLLEGLAQGSLAYESAPTGEQTASAQLPEPGTFMLLTLGATTAWYFRRRR